VSSRIGRRRAALAHLPLDPVIVAGPWVAAAAGVAIGVRAIKRGLRRDS
jgi:hypothetical protein